MVDVNFSDLLVNMGPMLGVLGAGFWFKRWVSAVDNRLKSLGERVNAISEFQRGTGKDQGGNPSRCQRHNFAENLMKVNSDLSHIRGSLDALWKVVSKMEGMRDVS